MIYFDHAATTPIKEEVRKSMCKHFADSFGNPSSIYKIGREARQILEDSREKAVELLGAEKPNEIIFTSGATEANNLALRGVCEAISNKPHIVVSSIEHHCVLDVAKHLKSTEAAEVTWLPVSKEGIVDPKDVEKSIKENTVLVSVMMGNNEMGALQPIKEIGLLVKKSKVEREKQGSDNPLYFHTDAVQAFAFSDVDVEELGVDLLSLTAHKFYGPKGVGLLYVRSGTKIAKQQFGGAQEKGRRAGTENVPYIVGMVKAMELAVKNRAKYSKEVGKMTDYLIKRMKEIENATLLGPKDKKNRLPHIANFLFKGVEGESILINLDMVGVATSSGSACTSGSLEPSHVTKAMGYGDLEAHGSVRFSLGDLNKKSDVDELMKHLPKIIDKLRAMSPVE
jgi:cysteine desulfurase